MRARAADGATSDRVPVRRGPVDEPEGAQPLRNNGFRDPKGATATRAPSHAGVLALQRTAGNAAVGEMLSRLDRGRAVVQRDDDAPTVSSPLRRGVRLLPGSLWLAEPGDFLRNRPSLVPQGGLPLPPPAGVEKLIDWGDIGTAYRDRRLVLEDRDRAVIVGHWQRWYPVAQALYKLPLAKSLFDTPAAIMNTMSAKMIDSSLAGDRPDIIEQFNQRAEQFGVKTTTVAVTVGHF